MPITRKRTHSGKLLVFGLQEQEKRRAAEEAGKQLEWSGAEFAAEVESIEFSDEVLKGIKTFMCTIAKNVKEASSLHEIQRLCYGLALLLLRDYDSVAFDKLLKMMRGEMDKE